MPHEFTTFLSLVPLVPIVIPKNMNPKIKIALHLMDSRKFLKKCSAALVSRPSMIATLSLIVATPHAAFGQASETFTSIPTASSTSYLDRSWTGDDGVNWTAKGARTDQTLVTKAICFGNSGDRWVTSPVYSGGMGTLGFKYVRAFTGSSARSLEVWVNGAQVGTAITVSPTSDVVTSYSTDVNVGGDVQLQIKSTGAAQVKVDDIVWTPYIAGPDGNPPIIASRVPAVSATNVPVNTSFSITFDEAIATGAGTVELFKENGAIDIPVTISSVAIDGTGKTASFTASAPLDYSATYYILVDGDAFFDLATPTPNAFPGIPTETAWSFTTAAPDIAPPIATLIPADEASNVLAASNLTISYNETVQLGTGTIKLRKSVGSVLVEDILVPGPRVTFSGNALKINPTELLEPNTSYEVEVPGGVVSDLAGNGSVPIAAGGAWSFTTKALPSVVISQYYEGTGLGDRYVELKNLTPLGITLTGYRLTVWSNTSPSDNEGWKSGTGTTDRVVDLGAVTIPASGYVLIANTGAVTPSYAANSANYKSTATDFATFFDGDDSVVLYSGATNAQANVVDAVSVVASEANATSFFRLTDTPAFTFDIGYSIIDDLGKAWGQATNAAVDTALSTAPEYLKADVLLEAPVLGTFAIGNGAAASSSPRVTLDYTRTGGVPTEYMVSSLADFAGASWVAMPGSAPVINLSADAGTKTLYFKIRNAVGESAPLTDTIERVALTGASSLLITQYYEGTNNNKYVELTNTSELEIDLSTWKLGRWNNTETENWKVTGIPAGSGSAVIDLSGSLPAGATIVISNSSAASPVAATNAYIATGLMNHTGNDSYILYEGTVTSANIRDAASFTAANEGAETSFVRIAPGIGFDFDAGTSITGFASVWQQVTLAVVNAAIAGEKEHLGTYLDAVSEDYAAWIDSFFEGETNENTIGFNADPDFDGIPNGVEALIGGNPDAPSVFTTSDMTKDGDFFTFLYPRSKSVPTGVTATYEWSTDLSNWQGSGESFGGVTVTLGDGLWDDTDPEVNYYQVTAEVTVGTVSGLFVRVLANK